MTSCLSKESDCRHETAVYTLLLEKEHVSRFCSALIIMERKDFEKFMCKETLIGLVENRPVLWDSTLDVYKDKAAKINAWREICGYLMKDFVTLEQKERQAFGKFVIKKWSQTRDAWIRTLNEQKKEKKTGVAFTPYRYHNQLIFLKKVVSAAPHEVDPLLVERESASKKPNHYESRASVTEENNKINEEDSDSKEEEEEECQCHRHYLAQPTPKRRKRQLPDLDENVISYIDQQLKTKTSQHEERYLSFFKSLLPSLAMFDDDQTLEFQSGVINLLQRIKKSKVDKPVYDWPSPQTSGLNHDETRGNFSELFVENVQSPSLIFSEGSEGSVKLEPAECLE